MITDFLIPLLQQRFPDCGLRVGNPPEPCAIFPGIHPEVGDIVLHDDGDEVTMIAGKFTHSHFSNYDDALSPEGREKEIAEDVADFLAALFADQVVMWGSHKGGGGWRRIDVQTKDQPKNYEMPRKEYVWSGPRSVLK